MDPLTHAILGAALPAAFARRYEIRLAAFCGVLANLLPNIDILFGIGQSVLFQESARRHFTHSIALVPVTALATALAVMGIRRLIELRYPTHRHPLGESHQGAGRILVSRQFELYRDTPIPPDGPPIIFSRLYVFGMMGAFTRPLLEACGRQGTLIFWPISNERIAWNLISPVDFLFTGVLLAGLLFTLFVRDKKPARWGILLAASFLGIASLQRERARDALRELAEENGIQIKQIEAIPTMMNVVLWRGLVLSTDNRLWVYALRIPPIGPAEPYPGGQSQALVLKKDFPRVNADTPLGRDLARLQSLSRGFAARHPTQADMLINPLKGLTTESLESWNQYTIPILNNQPNPQGRLRRRPFPKLGEQERLNNFRMLMGEELPDPPRDG